MNPKELKQQINLQNTQPVYSEDGNILFAEGYIIRKVSRFITATEQDVLMPIPVMYDVNTGKILIEMLPNEIKQEVIDFYDKFDSSK